VADRTPSLIVKKESSLVIWRWSNNHMQRSARSEFINVEPVPLARPLMWSVRPTEACINPNQMDRKGENICQKIPGKKIRDLSPERLHLR
jgi:hypothetical protein